MNRLSSLESRFNDIELEQTRQDFQLKSLQDVIANQQMIVEKLDTQSRQSNLIVTGVPEGELHIVDSGEVLESVIQKLNSICRFVSDSFSNDDIASCFRIGRRQEGKVQPIKVKFTSNKMRNDLLYNQRRIRESVKLSWGNRIYVNRDLPPLTRSEDHRLRMRLKEEKKSAHLTDKIYIKN